jgi:hypothetical protein
MKNFVIILLLFALTSKTWAQYDSIPTVTEYKDDIDELFKQISYRGGIGLFIPASKDYFRIGTFFEGNMNIPISTINSIELVVQIGGWDRENNFNYVRRSDSLKGTSRVFINGLLKFKRDIVFFEKSFISIGAGLGVSTVFINTEAYISQTAIEETAFENMTSFILSPEVEYLLDISENTQFSLSFSMQYATYKLKSALQNDIGKWYYLPKITYRF